MYRNTKFLEVLHKIRQNISEDFDYDLMRLAKFLQDETSQDVHEECEANSKEKISAEEILTANYGNGI